MPEQKLDVGKASDGASRVVIFNASSFLVYGLDRTGLINVYVDGAGAGRLNIGRFMIVELRRGSDSISLAHRDFRKFESTHEIDVTAPLHYLRINATLTSHEAKLVPEPPDFAADYSAQYP